MKQVRKKNKSKFLPYLLSAILLAALGGFLSVLFFFNANYQEIYRSPRVSKAHADFTHTPLMQRSVSCVLSGEWEFFYNQWIVTDGEEKSNGLISVPERWTGRQTEYGVLPRTGYASYRLTIDNVEAGLPVYVFRKNYAGAYRVFINGQLNVVCGTVSKDISEVRSTGYLDAVYPYMTDGGSLTVVLEHAANGAGGLCAAPWFAAKNGYNPIGSNMGLFTFIIFGVCITSLLGSILLTVGFYRYDHDPTLPPILAALFFHFCTSKDMVVPLSIPFSVATALSVLSGALSLIALTVHLLRAGIRPTLRESLIACGIFFACIFTYGCLIGTNFAAIPAILFLFSILTFSYILFRSTFIKRRFRAAYAVLLLLMVCVFAMEFADGLGLLVFGTEYIFSVILTGIIALFFLLGLRRVASATRDVLRAHELERELEQVKRQALKAQIKPHFIFNSLTAIQSLYHQDTAEGDKALERFARHLRLNVDADGEELIPFEREVKNILNYFELENLRLNGMLTLLLDISYSDFEVPVLSLQPLIENAIRHAETHNRKNGYISLTSAQHEQYITVTVSDNGKGFDPAVVEEGVGLTNARERLTCMLHAKMKLKSAPAQGTEIEIIIPLKGEEP